MKELWKLSSLNWKSTKVKLKKTGEIIKELFLYRKTIGLFCNRILPIKPRMGRNVFLCILNKFLIFDFVNYFFQCSRFFIIIITLTVWLLSLDKCGSGHSVASTAPLVKKIFHCLWYGDTVMLFYQFYSEKKLWWAYSVSLIFTPSIKIYDQYSIDEL